MPPISLLRYTIAVASPQAHLFQITLRLPHALANQGAQLALPAWVPGSYLIRDFARHVISIQATVGDRAIAIDKIDKHTWQLAAVDEEVLITWQVYAFDTSVRAAYLDTTRAFFNGSSVFLYVRGAEHWLHQVEVLQPDAPVCDEWRVATGLTARKVDIHGFGLYQASDYDELIDHPFVLADFLHTHFHAYGVAHEVVITGQARRVNLPRLADDMKRICETQIRFFEPRSAQAPVQNYMFFIHVSAEGYGGLEHRNSCALICGRDALPSLHMKPANEAYRSFLGLVSHEYFHTWHVKRIKPAAFVPYQLDRENPTQLLWIFEGFTSYYDDLLLVRAGLISPSQYLKQLAKTIGDVLRGSGRLKQSVAESSFDAWIKYYRQDENSPNTIVSYYAKGSLVALCLDLWIRSESGNKKSLGDVMRLLWQDYGRDFYNGNAQGLGEDDFITAAERATELPLKRVIRDFAYSTHDLPLKKLITRAAVSWRDPPRRGVSSLGIKTKAVNGQLVITIAHENGAAQLAGLSGHDTLVAIDDCRVLPGNLDKLLERYAPGEKVKVHVFRQDELLAFKVELQPVLLVQPELELALEPEASALALRQAWLGEKKQAL